MTVRILLIDDHRIVRTGLRTVLEAEDDFQVVGEADNGAYGLCQAIKLRPDVVLTDLLLPDMDGVAVTQRVRAELHQTQVVVLTSASDEDQWMLRAIRAGAISYLVKTASVQELVESIRKAAAGQAYVCARVAARLMQEVQSPYHLRLTDREREVLQEITVGRTDKEIARSLAIALSTVKSHVRSILDKLGVDSRTQAVVYVLRHNMFSLDELRIA